MNADGLQLTSPEPTKEGVENAMRGLLQSTKGQSFCTSGCLEAPSPQLKVKGVPRGSLKFDASRKSFYYDNQCSPGDALLKVAEKAPFGRGSKTVVDESVRKCYQISPSKITLSAAWVDFVNNVMARRAADELGVFNPVSTSLHKLVVYGAGGKFRRHVDGEKEPGMFATLVVLLPSWYEGGELVFHHDNTQRVLEEKEFHNYRHENHYVYFAFYTDCEHEVAEVISGERIALVYNLRRAASQPARALLSGRCSSSRAIDAGQSSENDKAREELALAQETLTKIADSWERADDMPPRIAFRLNHVYTPQGATWSGMKGRDLTLVNALRRTERYNLRLAVLEKHSYGNAKEAAYGMNHDEEDLGPEYLESLSEEDRRDRKNLARNLCSDLEFNKVTALKLLENNGTVIVSPKLVDYQNNEEDFKFADIKLKIDWDRELYRDLPEEQLFNHGEIPINGGFEFTGNEGIKYDLLYRRAVLLVNPIGRGVDLETLARFDDAFKNLEKKYTYCSGSIKKNVPKMSEMDLRTWKTIVRVAPHYPIVSLPKIVALLSIALGQNDKASICKLLPVCAIEELSEEEINDYEIHKLQGLATDDHLNIMKDIVIEFGLEDSCLADAVITVVKDSISSSRGSNQPDPVSFAQFLLEKSIPEKGQATTTDGNKESQVGSASWHTTTVKLIYTMFDEIMERRKSAAGGICGLMTLLGVEGREKLMAHVHKLKSMNRNMYLVINILAGIREAVKNDQARRCTQEDANKLIMEIAEIGKPLVLKDLEPGYLSEGIADEIITLFTAFSDGADEGTDLSVKSAEVIIKNYETESIVKMLKDGRIQKAANVKGVKLIAEHAVKNHRLNSKKKPKGKWIMERFSTDYEEVQVFFDSNAQTKSFDMFASKAEADKFSKSFNRYKLLGPLANGHSVTTKQRKKEGGGFVVEVKKTSAYYCEAEKAYEEAKEWKTLMDEVYCVTNGDRGESSSAKRQHKS